MCNNIKPDIKKKLIDENTMKEYLIGDSICLSIKVGDSDCVCLGEICDIKEKSFKIKNVVFDEKHITQHLKIKYSEIGDRVFVLSDEK